MQTKKKVLPTFDKNSTIPDNMVLFQIIWYHPGKFSSIPAYKTEAPTKSGDKK